MRLSLPVFCFSNLKCIMIKYLKIYSSGRNWSLFKQLFCGVVDNFSHLSAHFFFISRHEVSYERGTTNLSTDKKAGYSYSSNKFHLNLHLVYI